MAKSKETKAAPKKSRESSKTKKAASDKAPKAAKPKVSSLSEEKVVDSDSDEEEAAPATTKKASKEKEPTIASQVSKKVKPDSSSDEESSEDESSEDEESADEQQQPKATLKKPDTAPAKVNGVKRKASESEDDESEESSSEEETEKEQPQLKKLKKTPTPEESSSEEELESDAEQEESTQAGAPIGKEPAAQSSVKSIPALPFEPPKGYKPLETTNPAASSPFASSSLADKQIWHITAPSNIPVKNITEVALSAIQNAEPVLHHKGLDYILARDKNHGGELEGVFLPSSAGYQRTDQKVDEHFIIQQKLELPDLLKIQGPRGPGSQAAADIATASVSTIRPQPKGLKMRYKPPGYGKGDPGRIGSGSDSEEEALKDKGKATQFPKDLGMHGVSDKPDVQVSEKKDKKKKRKSEDVEMVDADQPVVNGNSSMPPPSSTEPRKKDKKRKEKSETPERPSTANSSERASQEVKAKKESKEEKAKRKEAKRLKKEGKLNGSQ